MRLGLVGVVLLLLSPIASAKLVDVHASIHVGVTGQIVPTPPAPLRVTFAFGQPALLGQTDFVSIVRVVPAGNLSWTGEWWASSEAGASSPAALRVDATGAFVDHSTSGTSLQEGLVHVRYHFLSLDGTEWDYDAPPVPVYDRAPTGDAPILGGAAADAALIAFSPWNVMNDAAEIGYTLRNADGTIARDERVGGCADATQPQTESRCRVPYVIPHQGAATLELWDVHDGSRRVDQTLDVAALQGHPYVDQSQV